MDLDFKSVLATMIFIGIIKLTIFSTEVEVEKGLLNFITGIFVFLFYILLLMIV